MKRIYLTEDKIAAMDKKYRTALINSLSGFKSVSLIGTINQQQLTNLAVFSSVMHIGSDPALIGLIHRPHSVERHTLENILETKFYTINHISESIYVQAHQTAARYERVNSEFTEVGLTPEFHQNFKAPYVLESPIKYGLEFVERVDLKINNTILIIGQVVEVIVPENLIAEDGYIDIEAAESMTCSGLDSYHITKRIARLSYAKPNSFPKALD
jgi:flavin reductase (DIM6/NTAB) family NADH-FMN oxidoreductase RutF